MQGYLESERPAAKGQWKAFCKPLAPALPAIAMSLRFAASLCARKERAAKGATAEASLIDKLKLAYFLGNPDRAATAVVRPAAGLGLSTDSVGKSRDTHRASCASS